MPNMHYPIFIVPLYGTKVTFYFKKIVTFREPCSKNKNCSEVKSEGFGTFRPCKLKFQVNLIELRVVYLIKM